MDNENFKSEDDTMKRMIQKLSHLKFSEVENKQMEDLLIREKEAREDLNRAQEIAHIGSWRMNVIKDQLFWSDEAYRIFEISIGTALNYEMFLSFVHPDDRDEVNAKWHNALHGDQYDIEHRILVHSRLKWVRETAILEFDDSGMLQGGFGTVQDITRRKESEIALYESEEKFAAAFRSNPNGLLITQYDDGKLLDVNDSFLNILGFKREEVIGENMLSLNVYANPEERKELIRGLTDKGYLRNYEFKTKNADGSEIIGLISSELIRINGRKSILSTIQDITSAKKMQELLNKRNDSLVRINGILKDFVSIAAHDLRSPVSSILAMGECIAMIEQVDEKEKLFDQLVPQIKKLQITIDGLLEMINVETKSDLVSKKLEFRNLYDNILTECSNEYQHLHFTMEADFQNAPVIYYVEAYLISIMKNLMSNAIKYSSENNDAFISISTRRENEFVLFTIKDNGSGIDMTRFGNALFKPFSRFNSKIEGTGMGLYIVKNIIEQNGGHIDVTSIPGEGTTFYCYLKEYGLS